MPTDDKLIFNTSGETFPAFGRAGRAALQVTGADLGVLRTFRNTELYTVTVDLDVVSAAALIRQIAAAVGMTATLEVTGVSEEVTRVYPADAAPFRRTIPIEQR